MFFKYCCTMWFPFLLMACQSELDELKRADDLLDRGYKLEALKTYESIIERYPEHPSVPKVSKKIERIYNDAAAVLAQRDPESSLFLTDAQLRRWPNGTLAAQASNRQGELKPKVEKQ